MSVKSLPYGHPRASQSRKKGSLNMNRVYFAHNIATYGTAKEREVLDFLHRAFPFSVIVNPKENQPPARWKVSKQVRDYAKKHPCWRPVPKDYCDITYFYEVISGCEVFVIWNLYDKCGCKCEMEFAKSIDLPIFIIPASIKFN